MSRLPIRLRLTLAFAIAMAVVLAATGTFLYLRLGSSLDETIDDGLRARAAELAPRVAEGNAQLGSLSTLDPDERFVQVLDDTGRAVSGTPQVGEEPVVDLETAIRAARSDDVVELAGAPGIAGRVHVVATSVEARTGTQVVLVGASLEDRDETVGQFLAVLLVVGPAALLLTSLLGYWLATAALKPVESMRAEASAISASEPGRRLPLPSSHDEIFRLGETLNEMLDRLGTALERERAFVADASHELRTPLALLKTELELALRKPRTAEELELSVRSAAEETDRLVRLAEDLLLVARADQGRLPIRTSRVRVGELLALVAARFEHRADGLGRGIAVSADDELELLADPVRLEQALDNLVDNAFRHGGGTVRLVAEARDGRVELHVLDEGDGFPPEFVPRAFERFSRADEARGRGGTGLGLALVDVIAQAHGGTAQAASHDGHGADVWLTLPAAL